MENKYGGEETRKEEGNKEKKKKQGKKLKKNYSYKIVVQAIVLNILNVIVTIVNTLMASLKG
jgi:hypothetical protein